MMRIGGKDEPSCVRQILNRWA